MAITTIDGVWAGGQPMRIFFKGLAGTQVIGRAKSYWGVAGIPGQGTWDNTLNGVALSGNIAGALPLDNPASGFTYLAKLQAASSQGGSIVLCDRLWHNGGITITSTSVQSITSPTFPARDIDGSSNGNGVLLCVEVSANTGAGTPTIAVSYTNEAGVAGRVANLIIAATAASQANDCFWLSLQGSDKGVRSVQSIQLGATWTSGTINLVAFRPIAAQSAPIASSPLDADFLTLGGSRIFDSSVLYPQCVSCLTTTSASLQGHAVWTQG